MVADAEFLKVVVDVAVEAATTAVQVTMGPVQTLLHIMLMGGIKPTAASSSRGKDGYRKDAFQYYYDDHVPDKATCMVTGEQLPAEKIIAGRVYRQAWNPAILVRACCLRTNTASRLCSALSSWRSLLLATNLSRRCPCACRPTWLICQRTTRATLCS